MENTKKIRIGISANFAWNLYNRKNLLLALQKEWDIFTVSRSDGSENLLRDELNIPFIPLALNNSGLNVFADLAAYGEYKRIYAEQKPAIVLHFNNKPNIYGGMAAAKLGIPFIDNITGLGTAFEKKGILQSVLVFLYKKTFKSPSGFAFFQNKDDKKQFIDLKIIDENRTGLLPGSGVDISKYTPQPATHTEDDGKKQTIDFIFSGRLVKTKGIAEYIEAARKVRSGYKNTRFHIIGELKKGRRFIDTAIVQKAAADGIIIYHGQVKDPEPLMQNADCVVLPSYYREGVPRVLLEGAAMGKPLIAANSIGTREPVHENENGFLCAPQNACELAKTLVRFICLSAEEKKRMGAASRKIAVEFYSDSIIMEKYKEEIKRKLNSQPRKVKR